VFYIFTMTAFIKVVYCITRVSYTLHTLYGGTYMVKLYYQWILLHLRNRTQNGKYTSFVDTAMQLSKRINFFIYLLLNMLK